MIQYAVGMSLGPNSSIESGVAVLDLATKELIHIEKLFSMTDVQFFFENYSSLKNSVISISLPWDNTMLEGKWRVLSKSYQLIHTKEDEFLNRDNWMQRFSPRGCDFFLNLKKEHNLDISRFEVYLTRQKMNLYSNFKERSSADCKFLQSTLRYEYGFDSLPTNMMPVAQLEAIIGCMLGEQKLQNKTTKIFNFHELDVINI